MKKINILAAASAALMLAACAGHEGWTIEGSVEGAPETTMFIEIPAGAQWVTLDSVKTDAAGKFAYTAAEPAAASIYRLRLGDRHVYFPVDSIETVTLTTTAANFDNGQRLDGSVAARGFSTVDSLVNASIAANGALGALNDENLVNTLGDIVLADSTCLVSYYAVTRMVDGRPIFDFATSRKIGIIGAAANRWNQLRPNDDRTAQLRAMHIQGKAARNKKAGVSKTMEATLSGFVPVDLVRKDANGKEHDFNAVATRGGVTVLNLTRLDYPDTPALTVALSELYKKYHDRGLEIFQVAFDPNEGTWRQAAMKLPWISVYNRPSDPMDVLLKYNADPINSGTVSFVLDRNGEIVCRVADASKLDAAVAKLL